MNFNPFCSLWLALATSTKVDWQFKRIIHRLSQRNIYTLNFYYPQTDLFIPAVACLRQAESLATKQFPNVATFLMTLLLPWLDKTHANYISVLFSNFSGTFNNLCWKKIWSYVDFLNWDSNLVFWDYEDSALPLS